MAINSPENQSNDSRNWQVTKKPPLSYNESITSSSASSKRQRKNFISPYLNGDKAKLHSRVTEKKVVQRKATDFTSSFPLAVNIYKANSDEFKIAKQVTKKGKKCIHTLPNDPTTHPQTCTVSDMNDSEYYETKISRKPKPKVKKRRVNKNNPEKNIEIYDRDAKYCSQLNINLDSSSSDMFQHLTGDGRKVLKKSKNIYGRNQLIDNDVWAVLRNINNMQFIPSPPMSGTSIESLKKMSTRRRTGDRNDASFIETCRTEEFAYISYDSTSLKSPSRSSSFDRVTVIGKQDDVTKTYTYTKRGTREQQRKREVLSNKKSRNVSKNVRNKKTESNKKELQQKLNIQADVPRFQNENIMLHKEGNLCRKSEHKIKAVCASEAKCNAENILTKADTEKSSIASESERQEQLNGITRVVLSKGLELHDSKNDCKQREARKLQSRTTSPKRRRTQITAEIRRKLANLKYPITVTGKEKLSSYIRVDDYKPPQFSGLDKHIWPFMIKWLPDSQKATMSIERKTSSEIARTEKPIRGVEGFQDNEITRNGTSCKLHNCDKLKRNKNQISSQLNSEKEKPMRMFKDKMLNLMYSNKYTIIQNAKNNSINDVVKLKHNSVNIETQTHCINNFVKKGKRASPGLDIDIPHTNNIKTKSKHSWSKAKWASDFIENVIRKVKCGVYYGQESKKSVKSIVSDCKLTQTDNLLTNEIKFDEIILKEDIVSNHFCYNGVIPGFEDNIQDLKLETVSKSQIAVKHCNTNVVVQFDIASPIDTNGILQNKDSILLVPIEISASKIYKYKATITNAILPAELCSIFPKMLSHIFDSNITALSPQPIINNIECHNLFPIKELTHHECLNTCNKVSILNLSNTIPILQNGRFSYNSNSKIFRPKILTRTIWSSAYCNLLPKINAWCLFENILHLGKMPFKSEPYKHKVQKLTAPDILADNIIENNKCTAIVPYVPNQSKILDLIDRVELKSLKTNSYWFLNFDLGLMNPFKVERFGTKTVVSLYNNPDKKKCFVVNNLRVELIYKHYENVYNKQDSFFHDDRTDSDGFRDQDTLKSSKSSLITKKTNRRKSYVKLCKKCKSTSSISYYKRNTPLQNIVNLDEFFQALGSAKSLSSAIDGDTERKILLSVVEMKTWITAITPRQALMILLLANKKESSNIIRFRNVILQGIAMNRITKISELDMEIEVIERESLNNSALFQGITYVPASAENQDNLLEELCWIAKTTASDYQKPFDKTSERLLRTLLGKRNKLNPSYLRVMARYVGLGLLKSK